MENPWRIKENSWIESWREWKHWFVTSWSFISEFRLTLCLIVAMSGLLWLRIQPACLLIGYCFVLRKSLCRTAHSNRLSPNRQTRTRLNLTPQEDLRQSDYCWFSGESGLKSAKLCLVCNIPWTSNTRRTLSHLWSGKYFMLHMKCFGMFRIKPVAENESLKSKNWTAYMATCVEVSSTHSSLDSTQTTANWHFPAKCRIKPHHDMMSFTYTYTFWWNALLM